MTGIVIVLSLMTWIFEIQPIYKWLMNVLPVKAKSNIELIWCVFSAGVGLFSVGIGKLFLFLGSEDREKKLYERFYKENVESLK